MILLTSTWRRRHLPIDVSRTGDIQSDAECRVVWPASPTVPSLWTCICRLMIRIVMRPGLDGQMFQATSERVRAALLPLDGHGG